MQGEMAHWLESIREDAGRTTDSAPSSMAMMDEQRMCAGMPSSIPEKESLRVEFKSDRSRLPDTELVRAVVCLANTEGGDLYLGVEKDGTVTGLHREHANRTGLAALVANRTIPPLSVRVECLEVHGKPLARINIPKSRRIVSTSDGVVQRRRVMADGTPQCVPFYPHEYVRRESELGILDYSALPVTQAVPEDLDPLERERLRQMIERYGGDRSLLGLSDNELDGAIGFVRTENGRRVPTVAGLLLLGREARLKDLLPTHEVAFQVLEGTNVKVNDFYRAPLLRTFERIMEQFEARVEEDEVQVGLFRVPVPTLDRRSFREAFINALTHRDYTRLGACHVRWDSEGLVVSNPGGFVEGVTVENLLIVEPRPRNPRLADAFKRIGLAERTGRGVDLIFQGLLRYGRPAPDYSRTDADTVVVRLSRAEADIGFLRIILTEEERIGAPMPIDSLIILARLRQERRLDVSSLANSIQKEESTARSVLERLTEAGLVDAHGVKRGRTYTLGARVYRNMGMESDYVRQAGFDPIQQEQMVLKYVQKHKQMKRKDVIDLCRVSPFQATRLLQRLEKAGRIIRHGHKRGAYYVPAEGEKER